MVPFSRIHAFFDDWIAVIPIVAVAATAALLLIFPNKREVLLFPKQLEREIIFSRSNRTFDPGRAYVIVTSRCINAAEEAFFFSRDPSFSAGDVGNPLLPVWGELSPGSPPTPCGKFLRELKSRDIPFYVNLATDGALGEALATVVRKRTGGLPAPAVIVRDRLIESDFATILTALAQ